MNTIETNMKKDYVVNLHVLENCNYRCEHCFAHFEQDGMLSIKKWKQIIDNIIKKTPIRRFNFAGGEPFLYPHLDELIDYIHAKGIDVSIITNGFLLSEKLITCFKGKVSMVGISIDAIHPKVLQNLGRCTKDNEILDTDRCIALCKLLKENGIMVKINTVVSNMNLHEDFTTFIQTVRPDRWKILKMQRFIYKSYNNTHMEITDDEFKNFCSRHCGVPHIAEESMKNSYIFVDPTGRLIDNSNHTNEPIADLLHDDFSKAFASISFNEELYKSRYVV